MVKPYLRHRGEASMVCPNCRAVDTIHAFCSACGAASQVPSPYPASSYPVAAKPVGNTLSIIGMVLGAIAVVAGPVLLGLAGAALAQHAHKRGESLWKTSLIVSVAGLVLGLVFNGLLLAFRVGVL